MIPKIINLSTLWRKTMATTLYAKAQHVAVLKNEYAQIAIGIGLLFIAAQIAIPLQPVPITLHTVAVLLIGLFYQKATAIKTLLSYLGLGALGAPVFANFGGGIHHFVGPTAGYLWGFVACVAVMTTFREYVSKDSFRFQLLNCLLGSFVTYACGISWLALFVGVPQAFQLGLVPFILPGCLKAVMLSYATKYAKTGRWT